MCTVLEETVPRSCWIHHCVCTVLKGAVPRSCWIHHCVCTVLKGAVPPQLLDPSLCVQLTLNSSEGTALLQLPDPSLCVQCWRKLYSYSCWIHHCVCSVGGNCTPTVAGSITVCTVLEGTALLQLLDPSLCVQLTLNSSEGTALLQLPDPSLCVYSIGGSCTPSVNGSITVCSVLKGAVPHSYWIHHCV